MFIRRMCVLMLAGMVFIPSVHAVQLRLKYTKDQTLVNDVFSTLKGDLKIDGAQRLEGTADGSFGVKMNQKTLDIDEKGVANIEYRLDSLNITLNSEADMGEGKKKYGAKFTESGGSYTIDGKEEKIPSMDDVKSQSWQVKMNTLGSPVGFSLDSSQLGAEEAKEVQNLSEQIAGFVSKSAPLPEKDVQVGDSWENILSVKDLTSSLAKENPMLSAFADLGIEDVKTVSTLKEMRKDGDNEIATISSVTNFNWKEGRISLGVVNITVKNLDVKSESLTEMNNTIGTIPRMTSITTLTFEVVIETALGEGGPSTYTASGNLKLDSTTTLK